MAKLNELVGVTALRQDTAEVLKRVENSDQPVVITQRGRATAVLQSVKAYEKAEQERELLRLLTKGEKEIRAGKGYGLDEILAETDDLIEGFSG